jgi:S-adenosylmethionine decarboxylase
VNQAAASFDGPEKKIDVYLFSPRPHPLLPDLLAFPDRRWERVAKACKARIVSKVSTGALAAYILSESSLFVWPNRVMMMTCGKTVLTDALPELIRTVGKDNLARVLYERKNFSPRGRKTPRFEDDLAGIRGFFTGTGSRLGPADGDHVHLFISSRKKGPAEQEATLQLLMHDIRPALVETFSPKNSVSGETAARLSGLDGLYPRMLIDTCLFSPCGFSMNGIRGGNYFTIHVTPQPDGSYASFETDVIDSDYSGIVRQLLSLFQPGKFSLVLKTDLDHDCRLLHPAVKTGQKGYETTESRGYELDGGYVVTFLSFRKKTSG